MSNRCGMERLEVCYQTLSLFIARGTLSKILSMVKSGEKESIDVVHVERKDVPLVGFLWKVPWMARLVARGSNIGTEKKTTAWDAIPFTPFRVELSLLPRPSSLVLELHRLHHPREGCNHPHCMVLRSSRHRVPRWIYLPICMACFETRSYVVESQSHVPSLPFRFSNPHLRRTKNKKPVDSNRFFPFFS